MLKDVPKIKQPHTLLIRICGSVAICLGLAFLVGRNANEALKLRIAPEYLGKALRHRRIARPVDAHRFCLFPPILNSHYQRSLTT